MEVLKQLLGTLQFPDSSILDLHYRGQNGELLL